MPFIILVLPAAIQAQSIDSLQNQIDILRSKDSVLTKKINVLKTRRDSINDRISNLQESISKIQFEKNIADEIQTKINFIGGRLYIKPDVNSSPLATLNEGDTVKIFDQFKYPFFKASYNGKIGYISLAALVENKFLEKYAKQYEPKNEKKADKEDPRLTRLINKFGEVKGRKIYVGEIWIGMSKEMTIESRGYPKSVNSSTNTWGKHEQWVYPHGTYLYFDSGKLTSYQEQENP